jgi:nucleoside-diphosphate-sugar epimerase
MRVIITGGGGFLGQRLAQRLLQRDYLVHEGHDLKIDRVTLVDVRFGETTEPWMDERVERVDCPITDRTAVAELLGESETVSVFHLASIVSAQAEIDLDLALSVNIQGTINILDALRAMPGVQRLVGTSSLAVFGGELPDVCDDHVKLTPESTYGMTKATLELLVNDYTRRGHIDGRVARLPTVIIRPGSANAAASSVASAIFREPLSGRAYAIPVSLETQFAITDVESVVEGLITLHDAPAHDIGLDRAFNFPSRTYSIAEMLDSLHRVAESRVVAPTKVTPDPNIELIVNSWPTQVNATRALRLGLHPSMHLDQVVENFIRELDSSPKS